MGVPCFNRNRLVFKIINDDCGHRGKAEAKACIVAVVAVENRHRGTVNEEWFVKVVVRVDFSIHLLHTLRSDVFVRAEVRDVNQLPSHDESF